MRTRLKVVVDLGAQLACRYGEVEDGVLVFRRAEARGGLPYTANGHDNHYGAVLNCSSCWISNRT